MSGPQRFNDFTLIYTSSEPLCDITTSQVEQSEFCRRVIQARIQDKLADPGVILDDITTVSGSQLGDDIEGCLAGFPCQARVNGYDQRLFRISFMARISPWRATSLPCRGLARC